MRSARVLVLTVLTLLVANPAGAQSPLTKDDRKFFAWFDGLGYAPNLEKLPLVRVWTGQWRQNEGDPARLPSRFPAFLLADDGSRFKVLTLALRESSHVRAPARSDSMEVRVEPIDIEQFAKQSIDLAKVPIDLSADTDLPWLWLTPFTRVVLARACAARGLDRLAHELLDAARLDADNTEPRDLFEELSETIASDQYRSALMDLRDGGDRAIVRDRLDRMAKKFPNTFFAGLARGYAVRLGRMVREEREYAKHAKPAASLEGKARIAELIYQLRDEVGLQYMSPGPVYFLSQESREVVRTGPAQQLADIGYAAVPQLIAALQDPALTRTYYDRNGPRTIVSVRRAVTEILARLSGIEFDADDKKWRATRAQAREWWTAFQKHGERQTLIAGTLAGRGGQAELLVRKYPEDAPKVLSDAIATASEWYVRRRLVGAVATLQTGDELPMLRRALRDADDSVQVPAAKALAERGFETETVEPLAATWVSKLTLTFGDDLAEYLANVRDPRGIESLRSRWSERTYSARVGVILAFVMIDQVPPPNRAKAEALLAMALDDQSVPPPQGGSSFSGLVANPRICDLAARTMAENWSDRYRFSGMAPEAERDAQIALIKRTWRERGAIAAASRRR